MVTTDLWDTQTRSAVSAANHNHRHLPGRKWKLGRQALGQKRGVAMENLEGFGGVKWVKAFEEMGVMLKLGQGLRGKPSKTG